VVSPQTEHPLSDFESHKVSSLSVAGVGRSLVFIEVGSAVVGTEDEAAIVGVVVGVVGVIVGVNVGVKVGVKVGVNVGVIVGEFTMAHIS